MSYKGYVCFLYAVVLCFCVVYSLSIEDGSKELADYETTTFDIETEPSTQEVSETYDTTTLVVDPSTEEVTEEGGVGGESIREVKSAARGSRVILECKNDLDEPVTYLWTRQGGHLPDYVQNNSKEIQLDNVGKDDAGIYTCSAKSGVRSTEVSIILVVKGIVPYFTQKPNSYITIQSLADSFIKFRLEISIKPERGNGLILYNGFKGNDDRGDYIALRLIEGVPEFSMNLGEGATTVRADKPISNKEFHTIKVERYRKNVRMYVDGDGPFIGTASGRLIGLDLIEPMYLGGVPDPYNISPELFKHSPYEGFQGCISLFKTGLAQEDILGNNWNMTGITTCETCSENTCQNKGACQEALSKEGHTCFCPPGFSGASCSKLQEEACSSYGCGVGRCIDTENSFECQCPLGRAGRRCEREVTVNEPAFKNGAYIAYPTPRSDTTLTVSLTVKPNDVNDGILLYSSETEEGRGDFISLAIRNRRLEFKYDSGYGLREATSEEELLPGHTHVITATRFFRGIRLVIDGGVPVEEPLRNIYSSLNLRTPLYVGGFDKHGIRLNDAVNVQSGFDGCISKITIDDLKIDLIQNATEASNVEDCSSAYDTTTTDLPMNSITPEVIEEPRDVPPRILLSTTYVEVKEGRRVEVTCAANGVPTPDLRVLRLDNQPLNPHGYFENGQFSIEQVTRADDAQYQCFATNRAGSDSASFQIRVHPVIPSLTRVDIEPQQYRGQTGETVVLRCVASEDVERLRWSRQGGRLPYNSRENGAILTITNAAVEDSGTYICTATTYIGTVGNNTATVTISDGAKPPTAKVSPDRLTIKEGQSGEINCITTGVPLPYTKWIRLGGDLSSTMEQIGSVLHITNARLDDEGVYVCVSANALGVEQASARIDVTSGLEFPRLQLYPAKQQTIVAGNGAIVQCRAIAGYPSPKISWTRADGRPLSTNIEEMSEGTLRWSQITPSEEGEYVCSATNKAGTATATATIILHIPTTTHVTPTPRQPSATLPTPTACASNETMCLNGQCIDQNWMCDGDYDCADGSDEKTCGCKRHLFQCDSGRCVFKTWRCDSDKDCADGSDERDCGTNPPGSGCLSHQFECHSNKKCIPGSYHCDMARDCDDGSDEADCTKPAISRPPPPKVYLRQNETFTITCTAVGIPTPEIVWRLNGGNIPSKCKSASRNASGVLTCQDIQEEDQGSYSCGAINFKGSTVALSDTMLVVQSTQRAGATDLH